MTPITMDEPDDASCSAVADVVFFNRVTSNNIPGQRKKWVTWRFVDV